MSYDWGGLNVTLIYYTSLTAARKIFHENNNLTSWAISADFYDGTVKLYVAWGKPAKSFGAACGI
jgi:hypothetical protein